MSARSTTAPSLGHTYCCLRRVPHALCSRLKEMPALLCVAGKMSTGMDTMPKEIVADAMERAMWVLCFSLGWVSEPISILLTCATEAIWDAVLDGGRRRVLDVHKGADGD